MSYIKSLKSEFKRVTWINRKTLLGTVFAVGLISMFLTVYIYGVDSCADVVSRFIIEKM